MNGHLSAQETLLQLTGGVSKADRTAWRVFRALGDGEPGITTLWRGWSRLTDIANMYLILHSSEDTANS